MIMIKDHTQILYIDYNKTFIPFIRIELIRIFFIFNIIFYKKYILYIDYNNIFLNDNNDLRIYINQSKDFISKEYHHKIL
jgi:hypothetical protein